jgi:hypothetical protein
MVAKDAGRKSGERVVTHHTGWSRIDEVENGRRTTDYFGHAGSIALSMARGNSGEYVHLSIFRELDKQEEKYWDRSRFKTGERKVFLGESCEVWNVLRDRDRRPASVRLTKLSCITDDGIELWREVTSGYQDYAGQWIQPLTSSMEAVKIERRAVQPSEVHPPADLLELKSWVDLLDTSPPVAMPLAERADFETVMEASQDLSKAGKLTRTTRRRVSWIYTESMRGDGSRTIIIANEASGLRFRVEIDAANVLKRLIIRRGAPNSDLRAPEPLGAGRIEPALGRICWWLHMHCGVKESVLGEQCEWFNMTTVGTADRRQCRTHDGIVLKEVEWSSFNEQRLVAVRLQRRDVALSEVLPPGQMLTRRNWGLPE